MLSAAIQAAGTLGGAYIGNTISANSARAVNAANLKYAQDTYDTQINLANSAHQREVRDLRAAGLNPILSASGSGSASPAAPALDLTNPDASWASLGDSMNAAGAALGKGVERTMRRAQLESQVALNAANADNTAQAADRARMENEILRGKLDVMRKHPESFSGLVWKDIAGTALGPAAWGLDGAVNMISGLFGGHDATVGGETIHVPSAGIVTPVPGSGVHRRMERESNGGHLRIEHDGKHSPPKRRHN